MAMPTQMRRRDLLAGVACSAILPAREVQADEARSRQANPPQPVSPVGWEFFTAEEGAAVEALVDRLIPPDPETPGAKDAGVAVYIDRQLAGPYGTSAALYMRPPFAEGTPQQGPQSPMTPATRYRRSLAALDRHCRAAFANKPFREIPDERKDALLGELQHNTTQLEGVSGKGFFELLLRNTKEGFFADPVYGGNRDLVGWKMIGFPGARYDYRDWVERHSQRYPLPPVGITGRPEWTQRA
jgi:gluconate 2-dehydrogenase gamma chain